MTSKSIPLTRGYAAKVSLEDYAALSQHAWHVRIEGRARALAVRSFRDERNIVQYRYMHREIMQAQKGQIVDHINGDTLDNSRENLRFCTAHQSAMNRGPRVGTSSTYIGVTWHKQMQKWQASIGRGKSYKYLGLFEKEMDAARAYDQAALARYGQYARLNCP